MGAIGVMVPYVSNPEEARQAAESMRYPPAGIRGVAMLNRGSSFGTQFDEYWAKANDNLLTVVQIESREAVDCIDDMAAVDGVDVLFIGPMDLSVNLGIPRQYDHKDFRDAVARIVGAAKNHGKAAGILLFSDEQVAQAKEDGFTFVALGSDGGFVAKGMRAAAEALKETG